MIFINIFLIYTKLRFANCNTHPSKNHTSLNCNCNTDLHILKIFYSKVKQILMSNVKFKRKDP